MHRQTTFKNLINVQAEKVPVRSRSRCRSQKSQSDLSRMTVNSAFGKENSNISNKQTAQAVEAIQSIKQRLSVLEQNLNKTRQQMEQNGSQPSRESAQLTEHIRKLDNRMSRPVANFSDFQQKILLTIQKSINSYDVRQNEINLGPSLTSVEYGDLRLDLSKLEQRLDALLK